eukprot:6214357-Pleurochrysis_carterae.AAC.6
MYRQYNTTGVGRASKGALPMDKETIARMARGEGSAMPLNGRRMNVMEYGGNAKTTLSKIKGLLEGRHHSESVVAYGYGRASGGKKQESDSRNR